MLNKIVNKVAGFFQQYEESKYVSSHYLRMNRAIQLDRFSCGLQSAFVILSYYEKVDSPDEINYDRDLLRKDGIDTEPLVDIIKSYGLKVNINESANLNDIKTAINSSKPMLISIDEGEHWIVIYGYSKNMIFVLDSSLTSSLRCAWNLQDFLDRWDENWIAVVED